MNKGIRKAINLLVNQAFEMLKERGLEVEEEATTLIKAADELAWYNSDPEEDMEIVMVIAEHQLKFVDLIADLHREKTREILNM